MHILLTGAAGFIGSQVAKCLINEGDQISVILKPTTDTSRITNILSFIRVFYGDISDIRLRKEVFSTIHPDVLIHLAWYVNPVDYLTSIKNLDSLITTLALFKDAIEYSWPKIVGIGTCFEYARSDKLQVENNPKEPEFLYSSCKLSAYALGKALTQNTKTKFVWARPFHMHGPNESALRIIPQVITALKNNIPIDLTKGEQLRDHLHVSDVASAIVHIAKQEITGAVNICSGNPITLRHVLEEIGDVLGRKELLRFGVKPCRDNEVIHLVGDNTILQRLGWKPKFTLRTGIENILSS